MKNGSQKEIVPKRTPIGVITQGSLVDGVEMKLNPEQSVEDIKAGKFVVVEGFKNEFFSMITDLRLEYRMR